MPEDLSPDELERKKRLAGKFGQMLGRAVLSGASESISIVGSLFYKLRSGLSKKDRGDVNGAYRDGFHDPHKK